VDTRDRLDDGQPSSSTPVIIHGLMPLNKRHARRAHGFPLSPDGSVRALSYSSILDTSLWAGLGRLLIFLLLDALL
jgi:hypothetical protein